jgi:hypothetical protein
MFWRRHYCYSCYRHHEWLTFRRGVAAMVILAFLVIGVLDYPTHAHQLRKSHSASSSPAASRTRHHRQRGHAAERHGQSRPKPTTPPRPVRHARPVNRRRHRRPAGTTSVATASQGLRWTSFHGIELPTSPTAGPHHTRGGLASGFTDTPRGALLAAVNIAVRTAADWGPGIFRPTITSQVTGPNARKLLRADIRSYAQARRSTRGRPSQPAAAVEEAYRFLAYSPAKATIDLVTAGPEPDGNPVLVATRLRVIWRHGDWRLVAPPAGNWAKASTQISSLAGYTIFPSAG